MQSLKLTVEEQEDICNNLNNLLTQFFQVVEKLSNKSLEVGKEQTFVQPDSSETLLFKFLNEGGGIHEGMLYFGKDRYLESISFKILTDFERGIKFGPEQFPLTKKLIEDGEKRFSELLIKNI